MKKYHSSQPSTPRKGGIARYPGLQPQLKEMTKESNETHQTETKRLKIPNGPKVTHDNSNATNSINHTLTKAYGPRCNSNSK